MNVPSSEVTAAQFCVVMENSCAGPMLRELQSRYCTVRFQREREREREGGRERGGLGVGAVRHIVTQR